MRSTFIPSKVTAPTNQSAAGRSFDDNELSRCSSDGARQNAWIEYSFSTPATLDSIDFKFVGWRSRSYPLRVTIDGKTVWEGETERQLGHAGIHFPRTTGQVVRVALVGPTVDRDAFGKIIEVSTTRQAGDTGADQVPAGWYLGLFEIDFNGPPASE